MPGFASLHSVAGKAPRGFVSTLLSAPERTLQERFIPLFHDMVAEYIKMMQAPPSTDHCPSREGWEKSSQVLLMSSDQGIKKIISAAAL